jgi:TatD DNase family protein
MPLFDTHAHLDQTEFDADRPAVIERAHAAGVATIVAIGVTADSSAAVLRLAGEFASLEPSIYAAVGIHPNYCAEAASGDWDRVVEMAGKPRVVALGETGLDQYRDHAPLALQQDYFDRHLRLSQERDLPFIVHTRESQAEVLAMLREARARGPLRGVMHSFTGDAATAAECVELGMHISFAGMVTFKKSDDLRAVAATVPADRILIETDSPYLSPQPLRGKRNEPANVALTAECLAKVRGASVEDFAAQTTANARRLFQLTA